MRLAGRIQVASELLPNEREEMLTLMRRHYAGVNPAAFHDDLAEKDWVIQVVDPETNRLCGFSTQMLLENRVDGQPVHALFSGDTIIAREHWGDPALSHVWGHLALALIDAHAGGELYWFLISQGFRTYRFLPVFFQEYFPHCSRPTSTRAQRVLASLAEQKFGERFDCAAGLVRPNLRQYVLRDELACVEPGRLADPHVQYFLNRNPGHASGDELCCLAPLTRENFTGAAYRVIGPKPRGFEVPAWVSPAP